MSAQGAVVALPRETEVHRRHYRLPPAGIRALTPSEHRAMRALIRHGYYQAVADQLGVSIQTVKNQLSTAMRKLGVHTGVQAVVIYDRFLRDAPFPAVDRRLPGDRRAGRDRRSGQERRAP